MGIHREVWKLTGEGLLFVPEPTDLRRERRDSGTDD